MSGEAGIEEVTGTLHIAIAMKPVEGGFVGNALEYGVAGLNVDGGRIGSFKEVPASVSRTAGRALCGSLDGTLRRETGLESGHNPNVGRWPANVLLGHHPECRRCGFGVERRVVGATGGMERYNKKLAEAAYRPNEYQKSASDDGVTVKEAVEKWDCHPDCPVGRLDEQSGTLTSGKPGVRRKPHETNAMSGRLAVMGRRESGIGDSGGASRFFFQVSEYNG